MKQNVQLKSGMTNLLHSSFFLVFIGFHDIGEVFVDGGVVVGLSVLECVGSTNIGVYQSRATNSHDPNILLDQFLLYAMG